MAKRSNCEERSHTARFEPINRLRENSRRMKITVNGQIKELEREVSLDRLLELLSLPQQRVAIELNREVVRKKDWPDVIVKEADRIEVVHFVGGG